MAYPQLYHYTTHAGFNGMLLSKSIWMSHINFQNDSQEFYHALRLLKQVIEEDYQGLNPLIFQLDTNTIYPVYTFSMTEKEDLLSQWRGYCPNGGYCVSIDQKQLEAMMINHSLELKKCVYSKEEQIRIIKNDILGVSPELYKEKVSDTQFNNDNMLDVNHPMHLKYLKMVNRKILDFAPLFKDSAFEEECEWRIKVHYEYDGIFGGVDDIPPIPLTVDVKFREGKNSLIPYIPVPLTSGEESEISFTKVIVGPNPSQFLAKSACKLFFEEKGQDVDVTVSNTPYKNW